MRLFLVLIILIIASTSYLWPFVKREKACYDSASKLITDIQYFDASRGHNQEKVCDRRSAVLFDLEDCLIAATASGKYTRYMYPIIEGTVSLIRPVSQKVSSMKSEHNKECVGYRRV